MKIREKLEVSMRLAGKVVSHARTDVTVRGLTMTVDEPPERGGSNQGLTPTETLMAALLGCTNVITQRVAEKNGVHIDAMDLRLEAQFDRRGVRLQEEVDVPFPKVTLYIDVKTGADDAKMAVVKRELGMFCAVSKVIRASGTEIEEVWTVTRP